MSLSNWLPSVLQFPYKIFGFIVALKIASIVYKKYINASKGPEISDEEDRSVSSSSEHHLIEDKIFFSAESAKCGAHASVEFCDSPTCATKNLTKLKSYLNSATKTLDVCVYYFTHDSIANLLIEAHKKTVAVRVIVDAKFATSDSSVIPKLKKEGIEVRSIDINGKMNNKFVIVDKALLITGSASWTYQALFNNDENILVTSNPEFFKDHGFHEYFEQLWTKQDKIQERPSPSQCLVGCDGQNPLTSCLEVNRNISSINDKLIFNDESLNCQTHSNVVVCSSPTCAIKNFNKLKAYLNLAKTTLDVCVHVFTYDLLAQALVKLHRKNVKVRIVLDAKSAVNSSLVDDLTSAGIEVKTLRSPRNMHNKFAIVDKTLLITGSADWTSQSFFRNYENILVTSSPKFIEDYGYNEAFERLWAMR